MLARPVAPQGIPQAGGCVIVSAAAAAGGAGVALPRHKVGDERLEGGDLVQGVVADVVPQVVRREVIGPAKSHLSIRVSRI